jgi:hypothetical protein
MNNLSLVIGPFNVLGIVKDKTHTHTHTHKKHNKNHSIVAPKTIIVPLGDITAITPFDSSLQVKTVYLAKSFELAWLFGTLASTWKPFVKLLLV